MEREIKFKKLSEMVDFKTDSLGSIIGYEPWGVRLIESIRESLATGVPVVVRLHSGSDYPCIDNLKLDMESHCVMIIGYDDSLQEFTVNDPWNASNGGEKHGVYNIPYKHLPLILVNGSLGATIRPGTLEGGFAPYIGDNNNKEVEISIGYIIPKGYIIDQSVNFITSITCCAKIKELNKYLTTRLDGRWLLGEKAKLNFNFGIIEQSKISVEFEFEVTLEGKRPYPYNDMQHFSFSYILDYSDISNMTIGKLEETTKVLMVAGDEI